MYIHTYLSTYCVCVHMQVYTHTFVHACIGTYVHIRVHAWFVARGTLVVRDLLALSQMVARLKQQVLDLKEELALATGKERTDALSQEASEW